MKQSYGERRKTLWERSQVCGICKETIPHFNNSTLDHIVPKSEGGTNAWKNLQLAHKKCNSRKGSKLSVWHSEVVKKQYLREQLASKEKGSSDGQKDL